MSDYLQLGPVSFASFELPPRIGFGGAQKLAVHTLPGGARVIDAMGRDDADIVWSGAFSGSDAADRARLLDVLRVEGGVLPLAWEAFCYLVVIRRFEASYQSAAWVPYRITCTVVEDLAQSAVLAAIDLAGDLLGDLLAAGPVAAAALPFVQAGGATSPGTTAFAAASASLSGVTSTIAGGMSRAGAALLAAGDPVSAATAAGTLASLADASGYAARALANLDTAGG